MKSVNTHKYPLLIRCAIECEKSWINAASLLYYSLLCNGGIFKNIPFELYVAVEGTPSEDSLQLNNLTVRFMPRVSNMPYLHKANILGTSEMPQASHVLLLDHDIIIRQLDNIQPFLGSYLCARKNSKDNLDLLIRADYAKPLAELSGCPWESTAYFNAGVVLVPADWRIQLCEYWCHYTNHLFQIYKNPLAEQVALSVAIAKLGMNWRYLPTQFNQTNWGKLLFDASIIHYNDFDQENKMVKTSIMKDYRSLKRYLMTTKNRFWTYYRNDIMSLITPTLKNLANSIDSFCVKH